MTERKPKGEWVVAKRQRNKEAEELRRRARGELEARLEARARGWPRSFAVLELDSLAGALRVFEHRRRGSRRLAHLEAVSSRSWSW